MPGVPSNRACERCKKRHVKCDETRPKCQRCTSAGVECPGYVQMRKFIDQGPTIRRRYAPYQDAHSRSHAESPLGQESSAQFPEPAEHVTQEAGALSASQSPTAFHAATGIPERPRENRNYTESPPQTSGLQTTFIPSGSQYQPGGFGLSSNAPRNLSRGQMLRNSPSSSNTTPTAEIEPGHPDSNFETGGTPSVQNEQENFQDIFSELMTGSEHEIAFLTRHFTEFLGPWLDLSDSKNFFAVYAPIRAINNDYLRYAIAALSAKHLGRLNGQKPLATGGISATPATMEVYPNSDHVDWILKGENYYYLAFTRMRDVISDEYGFVSSSAVLESPIEAMSRWLSTQLRRGGFTNSNETSDPDSFLRKVEALLGACAIFTMYKLLEAPGDHWQSLLVGIEPLFDSLLQLHASHPGLPPEFSHGERAAFWNFARQDYLGSYFTRNSTHLKHDNLALWKAAGIRVNDQEPREVGASLEDLAANSLIRLLNKVVNFLTDYKRSQVAHWNEEFEKPTVLSTTAWLDLCFEFQSWLEKIPETFRPSFRIERPRDMSNLSEVAYLPFPEIFYSLESCAAAMQHYHFGRMALLLNRPPDAVNAPGTAFDRLASLRETTKEVDYRCREICGIALSRPRGEVRVYMAPLLFAVGQCLETAEGRQVIINLLRGVETELGMATVTTANNLQMAWDQ